MLRWNPVEKLCAAIGLSLILLYLAFTALYWLNVSAPAIFWAVSAICLEMGILARRDIVSLASIRQVRRAIIAFGFLALWSFVLLAVIRHYSGPGWAGDWREHFQGPCFSCIVSRSPRRFGADISFRRGLR